MSNSLKSSRYDFFRETTGDTQAAGETGAPDTVHPDSFAAINKDWDFGDGSVKDNPVTAGGWRRKV